MDRVLRAELGVNRAGFMAMLGYTPTGHYACDLPEQQPVTPASARKGQDRSLSELRTEGCAFHFYDKPNREDTVLHCTNCPALLSPRLVSDYERRHITTAAYEHGDLERAAAIEGFLLNTGPHRDEFPDGWSLARALDGLL